MLHAAVTALNPEAVAAWWCVLTGNALVGPLQVRKGAVEVEPEPPALGTRLWLYSSFHCDLAGALYHRATPPVTWPRRCVRIQRR